MDSSDAGMSVRSIPTNLIDDDGNDMRRVAVPPASDAALTANIRIHGVLQPIGVRQVGNRFKIVFGRRRLRCARAAGLDAVPARVEAWNDDAITGVQAAENMQRVAPHPIDVWCTVRAMVDQGHTIAEAAEEIGLDDRATRRMERLGRLHPSILKLAEIDMPADHWLRAIANAPAEIQETAAKGMRAKPGQLDWVTIAARCKVERISRSAAIFDAAAHPGLWDEDLFAPADDETRFTTANVERFMALQQEALVARVAAQRAEKRRVEIATFDAARREVKLPKSFKLISTLSGQKPRRTECVFTALRPDGTVAEVLAEDVAARRAAEQKREQRAAAVQAAEAGEGEEGGEQTGDEPEAPVPAAAEGKPTVAKAGLQMIADAKTKALRHMLHNTLAEVPMERLCALLLLMLTADNVELRLHRDSMPDDLGSWQAQGAWRKLKDIAASLLMPGGTLAEISGAEMRQHIAVAMARVLTVSGPDAGTYTGHSGAAAEWIGAAIGAGTALPRFDTEAFLATVNGEALRKAAQDAGLKSTGSVAALRGSLVGNLPNWRPDAAQFGALPPVIQGG